MVRRAVSIAFAIASALMLAPRPAPACSPPYDPTSDDPLCLLVQLWTPSDRFPLQLRGSLRIGTFDRVGNAISGHTTFDPNVEVFVHRAITGGGYEAVAFQLVDQPGLVPSARQLQLADPLPGQYVVSSPQVTCAADPSPAGTGFHVGAFELEPEVPLPAALGQLHWLGEQSVEQTYQSGPGSMCELTDVALRVTHSRIELQLDAAAMPWRDVIDASWYVDGESYRGSARLVVSEEGVATVDLTRICSSSHPEILGPEEGPGPGPHTFKLVGRIEGLAMIDSTETTFTLNCAAEELVDGGFVGGCAAGGDVPPLCLIVLFVVAAANRRRRS